MLRQLAALLIAAAPVVMILSLSGCQDEVKTVRQTERVEESEQRMVSPGEEVLE